LSLIQPINLFNQKFSTAPQVTKFQCQHFTWWRTCSRFNSIRRWCIYDVRSVHQWLQCLQIDNDVLSNVKQYSDFKTLASNKFIPQPKLARRISPNTVHNFLSDLL